MSFLNSRTERSMPVPGRWRGSLRQAFLYMLQAPSSRSVPSSAPSSGVAVQGPADPIIQPHCWWIKPAGCLLSWVCRHYHTGLPDSLRAAPDG